MQGVSYNFIIKQIYIYLDRLKLIMINNFFFIKLAYLTHPKQIWI